MEYLEIPIGTVLAWHGPDGIETTYGYGWKDQTGTWLFTASTQDARVIRSMPEDMIWENLIRGHVSVIFNPQS